MEKFTGASLKLLREEINSALEAVGAKHGIKLTAGNATYTEFECNFKLKGEVAASTDFDPKKQVWDLNAPYRGLEKGDYGKTVLLNGREYIICGYDTSARTNCILIKQADGCNSQVYRINAQTCKEGLAAASRKEPTQTGEQENSEPKDFGMKAFLCGLQGKCSYGQTVVFQGKQYKLVDLNTKAPKYPLVCQDVKTGKLWRLPADALNN